VIGLGRFGTQVAESLIRLGHEVLAIDGNPRTVEHWAPHLTHVAQADATDGEALRQLGAAEVRRAVVAIGSALEASVLTVLALTEIGLPEIWGRATSAQHAKILSAVGAHHVIFPEAAIAERVAHLIFSQLLDFVDLGDDWAIAKTRAPTSFAGRRLDEIGPAERYGVAILAVSGSGERIMPTRPDAVITRDCVLVIEGPIEQIQRFTTLS
jgi:trk system potassium uptake protein TrkA